MSTCRDLDGKVIFRFDRHIWQGIVNRTAIALNRNGESTNTSDNSC